LVINWDFATYSYLSTAGSHVKIYIIQFNSIQFNYSYLLGKQCTEGVTGPADIGTNFLLIEKSWYYLSIVEKIHKFTHGHGHGC
jgi:hypothetical protein